MCKQYIYIIIKYIQYAKWNIFRFKWKDDHIVYLINLHALKRDLTLQSCTFSFSGKNLNSFTCGFAENFQTSNTGFTV